VLLLDAGPDFPEEETAIPLFVASSEHTWRVSGAPEIDWGFVDRDRAGRRGGRPIRLPRARVVGGSSMVNSTIAVRPAASDHDRWAGLGCPGWDWASVLPLYRRIETDRDFGNDPVHGKDGPIVIQRYRPASWSPVNRVFAEACLALGVPEAPDLNAVGVDAGVFGAFPHNRFKEMKQGALNTYLRAARKRPNLTIRGGALVDTVILEGMRAAGVLYLRAGKAAEARADRVIVSAGVYNTPAILQRSGIGPATLLRRLGIPAVADLPVGRNLTDHPGCAVFFKVDGVSAMTGRLFPVNWRGPAGADGEPPWHIHPFPADEEEGLSGLFAYLCRQDSVGTVEIESRDPRAPPAIDHNYLATDRDLAVFDQAYGAMREVVAAGPFAERNARLLTEPSEWRDHLKRLLASAHHQSGTCRMGADPTTSVVDPTLCVHGVEGLIVADTSVFPDTIMHNTNLAAYVVGERVADLVRGQA
jgi:choline dehydrogenase